ncbi:MAG: FAD-binding oxidoreductase [Myxococcales bacterium]|nr:FAD-binding oxidoreductase [Myxococcales bacterium]
MTDPLVRELVAALGDDIVTTDANDLAELGRDWTRVHTPRPLAVARPRTTEQVSAIVRRCNEASVGVVPSGGRTGLAAGAVAANGELVLSLARMNAMGPVDTLGRTVRVEAGAVTQAVHEHCAAHGLTWPVDFASKGSSQVGGNIATNAGGIRVIRYGLTRSWVAGLEVVLPSGEVLTIGGALEKDNTGIDLRQLFIGSEGILGVIVAATLRLTRPSGDTKVMLFAVPDLAGVVRLFRAARQAPMTLDAFEFFTDKCLARVSRHRGLVSPLAEQASHYVVLEAEWRDDAAADTWLAELFEQGLVTDGTMAQHTSQAAKLWELRESISESLSGTGLPHKNDIALPIAALEDFCRDLEQTIGEKYPRWEVCLFGHIGDGNLHVNVMKPDDLDKASFLAKTSEVDRVMFELVSRYRGSISAEHGIGLLKQPYLGYTRSPGEIAAMRAIKAALDPKGIMNPGKVI